MEKLMLLMKNKRFMYIFSGVIALISLILILKPKSENAPKADDTEELKNMIKETNKTVKLIKKKNEELERNAHGKSIAQSNSKRKSESTNESGNNEEGKGKTKGKSQPIIDDELDDDETELEPTE